MVDDVTESTSNATPCKRIKVCGPNGVAFRYFSDNK